jgi:energy-coupling factor transporter ATP-binding protein EcfA2
MRLDYLKIDRFKNLNGFAVDLDETCQEPVTVILGRNGSGKSNLFEALVIIFRDLINEKPTADFGYDLRYTLRGGTMWTRRRRVNAPDFSSGAQMKLKLTNSALRLCVGLLKERGVHEAREACLGLVDAAEASLQEARKILMASDIPVDTLQRLHRKST